MKMGSLSDKQEAPGDTSK